MTTFQDTEAGRRLSRDLIELFGRDAFELPPPVVDFMDSRAEEWEPGERLVMSFPIRPEYAGPSGYVQGGILAVAFDNAFGPVAFTAVEGMVVSVGLSTSFVRPLPVEAERFTVEVRVVAATRRFAFVRGEARDPEGRIVAVCSSEMVIPPDR